MWKWLTAVADRDRLIQENSDLRAEVSTLRAQLLEEIDSNREREDTLVQVITAAREPARRRSILSAPPYKEEGEEDEPAVPELVFGEMTKDMVRLRARDYMAEAAKNGMYYDFEELCKAIEANPQEFLSN